MTMIAKKLGEGHPDVVDVINDGQVSGVVNTISEMTSARRDGFSDTKGGSGAAHPLLYISGHRAGSGRELARRPLGAYSVKRNDEYLDGV